MENFENKGQFEDNQEQNEVPSQDEKNEKLGEAAVSSAEQETTETQSEAEAVVESSGAAEAVDLEALNAAHYEAQEAGRNAFIESIIIAGFGEEELRERARISGSKQYFIGTFAAQLSGTFKQLSYFSESVRERTSEKYAKNKESEKPYYTPSTTSRKLLVAADYIGQYAAEGETPSKDGRDWRNGMRNWAEATDNAKNAIKNENTGRQEPGHTPITEQLKANPENAKNIFIGLGMIADKAEAILSRIYDEEQQLYKEEKKAEEKINAFLEKYDQYLPKIEEI